MYRVISDLKSKVQNIPRRDRHRDLSQGRHAGAVVRLKPELAPSMASPMRRSATTLRAMVGGENSGYWLAPDGQNYEVITQLPQATSHGGRRHRQPQHLDRRVNWRTARRKWSRCARSRRSSGPSTPRTSGDRTCSAGSRCSPTCRVALPAMRDKRCEELVKTYELPAGLRFDVGGQIRETAGSRTPRSWRAAAWR